MIFVCIVVLLLWLEKIVTGTAHRYNWVNLAAAIKHPDAGKKLNLSNDTIK
jgi:hypothetical protein